MRRATRIAASLKRARSRSFMLGALMAFVAASLLGDLLVPSSANGLSRWTGGIDLYRSGVYSAQKTLLWCTAADVQIARNIVDRQADHSRAAQSRYFSWMRLHNRYAIPVTDGVDPAGWTAGLRHFVDDRYRLVQSSSFAAALRAAVTSLRRTNLPVGLLVANGDHAWVLTGFTATADPATSTSFTVTSVRVVGPLYGIQSRNGYDMPPDTRLTPAQLRRFWMPWHYGRIRMAWEGRILAIEGMATSVVSASAASASASPGSVPEAAGSRPVPTAAAMTVAGSVAPAAPTVVAATEGPGTLVAATEGPGTAADTRPVALSPRGEPSQGSPSPSTPALLLPIGFGGITLLVALSLAVIRRWSGFPRGRAGPKP